jgi:hypothetical protein
VPFLGQILGEVGPDDTSTAHNEFHGIAPSSKMLISKKGDTRGFINQEGRKLLFRPSIPDSTFQIPK